ncbi:TetR/AcrR family transcriptional regulator [Paenibacillus aceris]|uniref:AcrR family transcriptional regulator n=1 Tax=Paenibacillus aceris TaxID=869555 RepID=A0ABS4I0R6_9BACL|nr:TetR/AcrR family transcriptional regulator [Paenibacillus aceris]MBP1964514.1 AcrR family transcriptional regulator [Paenibacillus aceris]NHW35776.1 TetR/AcrR family transcriptional regulator [Paenibacillus aceris]
MNNEFEGDLPRGVALSWGLVKEPQRGPKREMSLKQIVDSAIAIADRDGLSAVSMNRVAASLGFTTMSLYRYVPSKDDLVLLMQDAVCNISVPEDPASLHWREHMSLFVQTIIRCFLEHPWLCDIPASGIPMTPNNLRIVDWALQIMHELPLNHQEKVSVVVLLTSYARVYGLVRRDMESAVRTGVNTGPVPGVDYSAALNHLVTAERFPYLQPVVQAGAYSAEDHRKEENSQEFGEEFDFGLERILDGIEQYVTSRK